ncbi:hypothetical protein FRC12_006530 [Ceratobasidium sp. 428]|nr:hypothetical protein FRC12_006530 [Ceratobasidium sp. 428]
MRVLSFIIVVGLLYLAYSKLTSYMSHVSVDCNDANGIDYKGHLMEFYPPLACAGTELERALEAEHRLRSWSPILMLDKL